MRRGPGLARIEWVNADRVLWFTPVRVRMRPLQTQLLSEQLNSFHHLYEFLSCTYEQHIIKTFAN